MLNAEKFRDEILSFPIRKGIALKNGKPCDCTDLHCDDCDLYMYGISRNCMTALAKWLCEEYEEPKINLPEDIEVDAPILVSHDGNYWERRHFARRGENDEVYVWDSGRTSFTASCSCGWGYAKLPDEEGYNESSRD